MHQKIDLTNSNFKCSHYYALENTVIDINTTLSDISLQFDIKEGGITPTVKETTSDFSYTFTKGGIYELKYTDTSTVTHLTNIFIYIYTSEELKQKLLTFRSPPTCCYKDKTHQISLSQNENFTSSLDLTRLKASIIRSKSDGSIESHDLGRSENTFTIAQSMLEGLDTDQYQLVIVEGDDYKQPLYTQIVQFSKLSVNSFYYKDSVVLSMTCIYPNLKVRSMNSDEDPVVFSCKYQSDSSIDAHCTLPDNLNYGFASIFVGDTVIRSDTFISAKLSEAHLKVSNEIKENTMKVFIYSSMFYLSEISKISIEDENKKNYAYDKFNYTESTNKLELEFPITLGLLYTIVEIKARSLIDNTEYPLTLKKCDANNPFTYEGQCLNSCKGYFQYEMECYNECSEAERKYAITLRTEEEKCVLECSPGYGLENATSKKCINCTESGKFVVGELCEKECPYGTSITPNGICSLPEDLVNSESNLCVSSINNSSG